MIVLSIPHGDASKHRTLYGTFAESPSVKIKVQLCPCGEPHWDHPCTGQYKHSTVFRDGNRSRQPKKYMGFSSSCRTLRTLRVMCQGQGWLPSRLFGSCHVGIFQFGHAKKPLLQTWKRLGDGQPEGFKATWRLGIRHTKKGNLHCKKNMINQEKKQGSPCSDKPTNDKGKFSHVQQGLQKSLHTTSNCHDNFYAQELDTTEPEPRSLRFRCWANSLFPMALDHS